MTTKATLEKTLSRRQKEVYDYIRLFIEDNGYAPTIRETAEALMLSSSSTIHSHINTLIRKGYLTHTAGGVRTLALTKKGKRPKVVTQESILKWISDQGIEETHDSTVYRLLSDLQEGIQSGRIC